MDYKNFNKKKILITGHTGFKGSWLSLWLHMLGGKIIGVSKNIPTSPSHYKLLKNIYLDDLRGDIANLTFVNDIINNYRPDYIFHLAAQSLVLPSYKDPYNTYISNTIGTLNILESLKQSNHDCVAVMITSDKCYENIDQVVNYKESDRLGGSDPYSTSKSSAELIIHGYNNSFFQSDTSKVLIASARAGNVIGGGDWATNRIVPDCVRSWSDNKKAILRNPDSTRPWQHVLEPINGYLRLASTMRDNPELSSESFNFGPTNNTSFTVKDLVSELAQCFETAEWVINIDHNNLHEHKLLSLDCGKAIELLNFQSKLDFELTAQWTGDWYNYFYKSQSQDIIKVSEKQIDDFLNL